MCCLCSFARSFGAEPVDRLVEEVVLAGPRAVVHADDVQQRRLAGARRPHDRDELAFLDVDVDAAQHVAAARAVRVGLLDVAQPDERVGRQRLRFRWRRAGAGCELRLKKAIWFIR